MQPPHMEFCPQGPCGDKEVFSITNCLATRAPQADEQPIVIHPKWFTLNGWPKDDLVEEMLPYGYREGQQIKDNTLESVKEKLKNSRIDVTNYTRDHVNTYDLPSPLLEHRYCNRNCFIVEQCEKDITAIGADSGWCWTLLLQSTCTSISSVSSTLLRSSPFLRMFQKVSRKSR